MLGSAAAPFTSAEKAIDPLLGYPLAFAKLCHHSPALFFDSPPHCFLPYSLSAHHVAKLRELEALFPSDIQYDEKDVSALRIHADFLWSQLDHLGNAGFDPAKFRVDPYGNVLHRSADPSSPLAWVVDHWFPQSRGGMTRVENLRLVQWQVAQCKGQRLEFLVPWWDLQLGISVNQFLSIFASKDTDFRQRAFSLLFLHCNGSSYSELESHYWPQHFKQKAKQDGFAAAAVVKIRRLKDHHSRADTAVSNVSGASTVRQWRAEEEEALLTALQKYRPVNWAEREKHGHHYRNSPDAEKVQLVNGCEELMVRHSSALSCMQQEKEAAATLGFKRQQTKDQVARLEKELKVIKQQNEREKAALEELENILEKHKKRVEKQRRWSETQSHYRQCLERIIRDTLHQSFVFKEKVRLNQAACSALLAKIQSHRVSCEDAELDLAKGCKEREALEILAQPNLMEYICRRLVEEGFLNNGNIMDPKVSDKVVEVDNARNEQRFEMDDKKCVLEDAVQKSLRTYTQASESLSKPPLKCMDTILEEDEQREVEEPPSQLPRSPLKRKVTNGELDVHVGYAYQRQKIERIDASSQRPKALQDGLLRDESVWPKMGEDKQLDELLQEVLTLQDKSNDVASDDKGEENEEQRITRLGKLNVDKWLQHLLLNSTSKQFAMVEDDVHKRAGKEGPNTCQEEFLAAPKYDELATIDTRERPKKGLGGLFRRMGFRQDARKLKVLKERADRALDDARNEELPEEQAMMPCQIEGNKAMKSDYIRAMHGKGMVIKDSLDQQQDKENVEMKMIEVERGEGASVRLDRLEVDSHTGDDVIPSELEFVKRMRELREEEKMRHSRRMNHLSNSERPTEEVCVHSPLQQQHSHHPDNLQKRAKEVNVAGMPNNTTSLSNATCLSLDINLPVPDRMTRSYSMRTTSSGGRWVLHTRKGSDVFPSTMEGDAVGEEVDIVLQPSSSFRRECVGCESHGVGISSSGSGSMGLKASLKTCTKAWKRAVSKRSSRQSSSES